MCYISPSRLYKYICILHKYPHCIQMEFIFIGIILLYDVCMCCSTYLYGIGSSIVRLDLAKIILRLNVCQTNMYGYIQIEIFILSQAPAPAKSLCPSRSAHHIAFVNFRFTPFAKIKRFLFFVSFLSIGLWLFLIEFLLYRKSVL